MKVRRIDNWHQGRKVPRRRGCIERPSPSPSPLPSSSSKTSLPVDRRTEPNSINHLGFLAFSALWAGTLVPGPILSSIHARATMPLHLTFSIETWTYLLTHTLIVYAPEWCRTHRDEKNYTLRESPLAISTVRSNILFHWIIEGAWKVFARMDRRGGRRILAYDSRSSCRRAIENYLGLLFPFLLLPSAFLTLLILSCLHFEEAVPSPPRLVLSFFFTLRILLSCIYFPFERTPSCSGNASKERYDLLLFYSSFVNRIE